MKKLTATVTGRVQGVGFRYFVQREANALGLSGWVRNLPAGDVELEAVGTSENLQALLDKIAFGPALARVDDVRSEITDAADSAGDGSAFRVR